MNDVTSVAGAAVTGGEKASAARPLALADLAGERQEHLPPNHPRQPGDAITLSSQARGMEAGPATQPPPHPLGFWDHANPSVPAGTRQIGVDASGSYKLD